MSGQTSLETFKECPYFFKWNSPKYREKMNSSSQTSLYQPSPQNEVRVLQDSSVSVKRTVNDVRDKQREIEDDVRKLTTDISTQDHVLDRIK